MHNVGGKDNVESDEEYLDEGEGDLVLSLEMRKALIKVGCSFLLRFLIRYMYVLTVLWCVSREIEAVSG